MPEKVMILEAYTNQTAANVTVGCGASIQSDLKILSFQQWLASITG